jgi:hypothetical protein
MDWTDFFTGITSAATSITKAVVGANQPFAIPGAPGSVYVPQTGSILQTNTGLTGVLGAGSNSTLILILLAVVLIFALRR